MVIIQRTAQPGVVLALSGHIEVGDVPEIQRVVSQETGCEPVRLDLQDITLVDREAVQFLAGCEANGVELGNCPPYLRQWINTESGSDRGPEC
ncbi:hypothetical protein [Paludibaculum fermentans]|uniref:hypothetical protein n=1 Tax=Paludibaculum fermentans TaxID=1473598 RepID=UPI003EBF426A